MVTFKSMQDEMASPQSGPAPVVIVQDDIETALRSSRDESKEAAILEKLCADVREIQSRKSHSLLLPTLRLPRLNRKLLFVPGNREKEVDKAFEGSYTRMVFIMALTYATLFLYLMAIGVSSPALNAVVPSIGFNLSTWSLPTIKKLWIRSTGRDQPSDA